MFLKLPWPGVAGGWQKVAREAGQAAERRPGPTNCGASGRAVGQCGQEAGRRAATPQTSAQRSRTAQQEGAPRDGSGWPVGGVPGLLSRASAQAGHIWKCLI